MSLLNAVVDGLMWTNYEPTEMSVFVVATSGFNPVTLASRLLRYTLYPPEDESL